MRCRPDHPGCAAHLPSRDCIDAAWQEIKDRKGAMRDGVWIKEGD